MIDTQQFMNWKQQLIYFVIAIDISVLLRSLWRKSYESTCIVNFLWHAVKFFIVKNVI